MDNEPEMAKYHMNHTMQIFLYGIFHQNFIFFEYALYYG